MIEPFCILDIFDKKRIVMFLVTINISLLVSVFTCSHEMTLTSGEEELDHVVIVPTTYVSNISIEE